VPAGVGDEDFHGISSSEGRASVLPERDEPAPHATARARPAPGRLGAPCSFRGQTGALLGPNVTYLP
jgi:hypothetical protein